MSVTLELTPEAFCSSNCILRAPSDVQNIMSELITDNVILFIDTPNYVGVKVRQKKGKVVPLHAIERSG
jgi:hypothetical protein